MDSDDVLRASDANFHALFTQMASVMPAGARREEDGLLLLSTGIPAGFFNPTFATGPLDDPEATVRVIGKHYETLGLPHVIVFRDAVAPGLAEACATAGMVEHWQLPLMVLDPVPPAGTASKAPEVEELVVETVDRQNLGDYCAVLAEGFGMPVQLAELLGPGMLEIEHFAGLLGRIAGEPVATSAVYISGGVAGVYNVAVPEAHRRRGLGEALTAAAARHGVAGGVTTATLQASRLGEPVYRRMGYETPSRYRQFEPASA